MDHSRNLTWQSSQTLEGFFFNSNVNELSHILVAKVQKAVEEIFLKGRIGNLIGKYAMEQM